MTDTTAIKLRQAMAKAIKHHVEASGMSVKDSAAKAGIQQSRLYQIIRGDVEKVSSDALANVLGAFGYQFSYVIGDEGGVVHGFDFIAAGVQLASNSVETVYDFEPAEDASNE